MTDAFEWWSAEAIADATRCPIENVVANWPLIFAQLGHCGIQTPNVGIGVIGTTAIESASTFAPVSEGCFLGEPEPATSHRNTLSYAPYWGRGEIQLTHASNYQRYGARVAELWGMDPSGAGFDFLGNPDLALDPEKAAAVIALYFRDTRALPTANYPEGYSLVEACEDQDWAWVRILVYGGSDVAGAQRIQHIADDLGPPGGQPVGETLPSYDWQEPVHHQNRSYDCSQDSLEWCLYAWGRTPDDDWMEQTMIAEGVMSPEHGLMDASGAGLAGFVNRHYGEDGYHAENVNPVSFDALAQEAGTRKHPIAAGGRTWNHWTAVRGYDAAADVLLLANPAPGYRAIQHTLTRDQFLALGAFSMVRVTHPAAEAAPTVPPPMEYTKPGDVGSGLLAMMAEDGTQPAMPSTFLPLGATPAMIEQCTAMSGVVYSWHLPTGSSWRYRPSA